MASVNARPAQFLILAFALILAPLGLCLNAGPAMAAPSDASATHHAMAADTGHSGHGDDGAWHFCPECAPPSFLKVGKASAVDKASVAPAAAPVAMPVTPLSARRLRQAPARRTLPVFHPPPPDSYLVRLQI